MWHTPIVPRPSLDIGALTAEERLALLEAIWDSLCEDETALPLTDAQRRELDRRLDEMERDGGQGIAWNDVLRKIRNPAS